MTIDNLGCGVDAATLLNHPRGGLETIRHALGFVQILHDVNRISVQDDHGHVECRYCTLPRMQTAWFKARMKRLRLTQDDIARALICDRTVVSKIIAGKQTLKLDQVVPLAQMLEVSPFEVLFRADMWKGRRPVMVRGAALLSEVEAGRFVEPPAEPPVSGESVIVEYPHETVFALIVRGDSMDRIAPEGSVIVIDYSYRDLKDGDLGVFRNDRGEATFKRYRVRGGEAWLQPESDNPRHAPVFPADGATIEAIGKVIDIRPEYGA